MGFTQAEAEAKEGERVEVLDDSFSPSKGTKVKREARGHIVCPHQTKNKVWTVNVKLYPPHAPKPDDDLIENIEKGQYERPLKEGDFLPNSTE